MNFYKYSKKFTAGKLYYRLKKKLLWKWSENMSSLYFQAELLNLNSIVLKDSLADFSTCS